MKTSEKVVKPVGIENPEIINSLYGYIEQYLYVCKSAYRATYEKQVRLKAYYLGMIDCLSNIKLEMEAHYGIEK